MPINQTQNANPYFDDFDADNNYYQILFKPGTTVQARELTQLQTILRDQIEKFGNHIFKNGSVVIPGNSFADLSVPFIKLENTFNSVEIDLEEFNGMKITGETSGVSAIVTKVVAQENSDPVTFYVRYISGSSTGDVTFISGENIFIDDGRTTPTEATLVSSNATGIGSIAYVNRGVYYVNGTFVSVQAQEVIIDKYGQVPDCHVLFRINQEIITATDDTSLLDPALGSYNFSAPGADRIKITLNLTTLPIDTPITEDYVEIMRYRAGILEEHAKTPKYSELEKVLAQRTFDESGSYVINGFSTRVRESLKSGNNNGVSENGDPDKMVYEVSSGRASVQGFTVERISDTRIEVDKARTAEHTNETVLNLRPEYGQYIVVSDITGATLPLKTRETIYLRNSGNTANSQIIGTARPIAIDYHDGDPADALYRIYVTDLNVSTGNTIEQVSGVTFSGNTGSALVLTQLRAPVTSGGFDDTTPETFIHSSGRGGKVKYWKTSTSSLYAYKEEQTIELPRVGDTITGNISNTSSTITTKSIITNNSLSGLVYKLPVSVAKTLRDSTNNFDLNYVTQRELTITTDGSGDGFVQISSGNIRALEVGTFVALSDSGVVDISKFSLDSPGTTLTITGGPINSTVKAYVTVNNPDIQPKIKTPTTNSQVISSPGSSVITLDKTDVYEITNITDSTGDITDRYVLNSGQTDYAYLRSRLTLKSGARSPSGSVTVNYKYFAHSALGDFFSVDSYPAEFLDTAYSYIRENGERVNLFGCIDFRPSVGTDGEFTGSGAVTNNIIVSGTLFTSALQYYIPRMDSIVLDPEGGVQVIQGTPSDKPYPPAIPDGRFEIYRLYVPEYTRFAESVSVNRLTIDRFTMKDIHTLKNRIDRVERYVLLNSDETKLVNFDVIDPVTGVSRYKTGYLVETFDEPLRIADASNKKFSATFLSGTLQPAHEQLNCPMALVDSDYDNFMEVNDYITLPFTETEFTKQMLSSRVTNLNPFLTFRWGGDLEVLPPSDTWVEVVELPENVIERTETNVVTVEVPPRNPPPSAGSGSGSGAGNVPNKPKNGVLATAKVTTENQTTKVGTLEVKATTHTVDVEYSGPAFAGKANETLAFGQGVTVPVQGYIVWGSPQNIVYPPGTIKVTSKVDGSVQTINVGDPRLANL